MKKIKVFLCPKCHNLVFSFEQAQISCCGEKLAPLIPKKAEDKERLSVEPMDGEWYITADHEMSREHYVSFAAFLTGDTLIVRKLYPEWNMETRIPFFCARNFVVVLYKARIVLSKYLRNRPPKPVFVFKSYIGGVVLFTVKMCIAAFVFIVSYQKATCRKFRQVAFWFDGHINALRWKSAEA